MPLVERHANGTILVAVSSLADSISIVVSIAAQEQMLGVKAFGVIAMM